MACHNSIGQRHVVDLLDRSYSPSLESIVEDMNCILGNDHLSKRPSSPPASRVRGVKDFRLLRLGQSYRPLPKVRPSSKPFPLLCVSSIMKWRKKSEREPSCVCGTEIQSRNSNSACFWVELSVYSITSFHSIGPVCRRRKGFSVVCPTIQ
jgi:hypothetical protein